MKHNKHHKQLSDHVDDTLFSEELHELADTISEIHIASKTTEPLSDPFDEYFNLMSSKIFLDPLSFRTRFIKGYHALYHFLEQQDHPETKSDT